LAACRVITGWVPVHLCIEGSVKKDFATEDEGHP